MGTFLTRKCFLLHMNAVDVNVKIPRLRKGMFAKRTRMHGFGICEELNSLSSFKIVTPTIHQNILL